MAEIVGLTASIIAVVELIGKATALSYSYLRGVKRAPKDLVELLSELGSLEKVLTIVQDLAGQNLQLQGLQTLNSNDGPLHGVAAELNKLISKLESTSKKGFKGSMERLKWPLKESETIQHISRIERYKTMFMFALSADQIFLSSGIAKDLQDASVAAKQIQRLAQNTNLSVRDIKDLIQSTNLTVQDIQRITENTNLTLHDIQELAKKSNCIVNDTQKLIQNTNLALQVIGTDIKHTSRTLEDIKINSVDQSSWRQDEETRQRAEKRKMVLDWLSSEDFQSKHAEITGAGKTFLSSSVIDHLQTQATPGGYGVAYIYFDYQNQDQQSPDHVIASIVKQLAYQLDILPVEAETLHDKHEKEGKRPTVEELYSIFIIISGLFPQVFLVFDALDEYNQDSQRGELLESFHSMEENGINLFLTSRPYPEDIQDSLQNAVRIEILAKEEDIRLYVQEKIDKNPRARRLVFQGNLKDIIISELVDCAQGMFLLVHFHIEYICQQTTKKQILATLERLKTPSSNGRPLDSTYDRAMANIRRQSKPCIELALSIFLWLVKARRTLTVDEIQVAVSIQQDLYELDEEDLPSRDTLLGVCAGLVIIDENSGTVRLAHYTVQDYLTRTFTIPQDSDFRIAMTCTTYLLFDIFAEGACASNDAVKARHKSHPFLEYAVSQLRGHLKLCDEELSKDVVYLFVGRSKNVSSYLQALNFPANSLKSSGYDSYQKGWHPLHIAAFLGHLTVARMLLDTGTCISVLDSYRHTALHTAASEGQEAMVKFLIQKGADISFPNHHGKTALHMAASEGHDNVVQALLEKGADILTYDYLGYTALHYAATGSFNPRSSLQPLNLTSQKRMRTIQILLDNGASISAKTSSGRTSLHMAVYRGKKEAVKLLVLLASKAEISIQDNDGQTPLHLAVSGLNQTVARILVEHGADRSARNNKGYTPLKIAVLKKHLALARFLRNGADHLGNTVLGLVKSELYRASPQQRYQVLNGDYNTDMAMDPLITKNTRSGIVTKYQGAIPGYRSPPSPPVRDSGASWWSPNHPGPETPDSDASISAFNPTRKPPLHIAISNQVGEDVFKSILDSGVNVSALDSNGYNALHLAIIHSRKDMVNLLLECGADVSTIDRRGRNALHLAIVNSDKNMVKFLLECGADVSTIDRRGENALHLAIVYSKKDIVKLLLDSGADISTFDGSGRNALHLATSRLIIDKNIIILLLDSGAKVSTLDENGRNLFQLAMNKPEPKFYISSVPFD